MKNWRDSAASVDLSKLGAHVRKVCRRNLAANGGKGCKCCQACPFIGYVRLALGMIERKDQARKGRAR